MSAAMSETVSETMSETMSAAACADTDLAELLHAYGNGLFDGDVERLRVLFHPRAMLYGEVRGQPYCRTVADYLDVVAARQSPRALGKPYGMSVLSVEVVHTIARARMRCVMLGFDYTDYLSLVNEGDGWRIVSKVFTEPPAAQLVLNDSA